MNVTAKESVPVFLTKGKEYLVMGENNDNFIVICDDGTTLGFRKSRFESNDPPEDRLNSIIEKYGISKDDADFLISSITLVKLLQETEDEVDNPFELMQ